MDARQSVGTEPAAFAAGALQFAQPSPAPLCSLVEGERFVGTSAASARLRHMIARLGSASATTLIHGETGTGKEIVALLLHRNSPRASKALVPINCAAIPEAMIEGELFGYEKGAFSSAIRAYPGKFGLADEGTLFLDEIGELSLAAQAKILRALEAKFWRPGDFVLIGTIEQKGHYATVIDITVTASVSSFVAANTGSRRLLDIAELHRTGAN